MQIRRLRLWIVTLLAAFFVLSAGTAYAQDGKLKIHVVPKQAYLFVDGKAINDGNHTISLPAGKHTVVVVNYGYKLSSQDVNIEAGKTTPVEVT
ncbi:MAG: PEGA domain-containing protein, partial [Candidatus Acidiferrales bacterium]